MAYTTYYGSGFADGSGGGTPITAASLNHMETGISDAATTADAAIAAPATKPTNGVLYWDGSAWKDALLVNANVDAAAAIAYSKLNLAGSIVNNDIGASAAIAYSKLSGVAPAVGYGTSLPGSPSDGDEYILVDSTSSPTYQWRFRYHSGSSNTDKWEFVGGAPAVSAVATSESTSSATYAALATAGPSVTLPRAGVYDIEIGAFMYCYNGGSGSFMSYDIGGTGAVDADAARHLEADTALASQSSVSRLSRQTGLTAVTLTAKYKTNGTSSAFANRWMKVTPVRVS